jgi:hypothetical protein
MRTNAHWKECESLNSYYHAQKLYFQLKEYAKEEGYDTKNLKVYAKKEVYERGFGKANSILIWKDGPAGWIENTYFFLPDNVCYSIYDDSTLLFYDL